MTRKPTVDGARRTKTRPPPLGKRRAATVAAAEPDQSGARQGALLADAGADWSGSRPSSVAELDLDESGIRPADPDRSGARPISVADEQLVDVHEIPEVRRLEVAVFEGPAHLASVQAAVEAAGHVVIACGSGRDGIDRIQHALRDELDVVIVGLPGGEPIIDAAVALSPRRPVVLAASTGSAAEAIRRASEAGADLAMARPHDVERLAPLLLAASRLVDERRQAINARGSETMLRARLDALVEPEAGALQPFELFQRVLELELKRARRYAYPLAVALFALEIPPPAPPPGVRGILRARAGNALIHSIRDIDMATELDHERFLVLLPYTSLGGAAEVAHRILESVAACPPITAAERVFEPRVIGAVAGAGPGQPLSFARLMRDATRALDQARRDGAELAVPIDVRGAE